MSAPRELARSWAAVGVCAAAFVALQWIPVPGIDEAALAPLRSDPLGIPFFGVVTTGALSFLTLLRLGRAWAERRGPRPGVARIAALVWVLLCVPGTLVLLAYVEELSSGSSGPMFDVVREPGAQFRVLVLASRCAGAALVWQLAESIRASGRASGTLVLFGGALALTLVASIAVLAPAATVGEVGELTGSFTLAAVCLAGLVVVVARRPPASWPVPVAGGVVLRSSLDVALAATLCGTWVANLVTVMIDQRIIPGVGVDAATARAALPTAAELGGSTHGVALSAIAIAISAVISALAWRSRVAPGGARSVAGAVVPAAAITLAIAMPIAWQVTGGAEQALAPPWWARDEELAVVAESDRESAERDAEIVRSRMALAEIDGTATAEGASRMRVVIHGARGVEIVEDLLIPDRFGVHLVVDDPDRGLEGHWIRQGVVAAHVEGTLDEVLALPDAPEGLARVIECSLDEPCRAWTVEPEPWIDNEDVEAASVAHHPESGEPYVSLVLTVEGARAFERLTGEHVREQLAIVVDGRALSVPTIQERIAGGRVQIMLGAYRSPEEMAAEAHGLADALSVGAALDGDWTIVEE